jgi:hypothetical protein
MRSKLTTFILVPAILAATALTSIPAMAATKTLNVPFSFTANGKVCPAGVYTVEWNAQFNLVKLESKDTSQAFGWSAHSADKNDGRVTLKFVEDGSTHTLQSVQYGPVVTSRLDGKTKKSETGSTQISSGR